jgi:L,D-transpeptidase catalytic domain
MLSYVTISALCTGASQLSALGQEASAARTIRYHRLRVQGLATVKELQRTYGVDGFNTILHVNRIDPGHLRDGSTLIVPELPAGMTAVSPFPASLASDSWIPSRMLIVSRRIQAFAAYQDGSLVRWGAVSTGRRETQTPSGLFATNWRSKLRRSSDNAEWLLPWYVNFINASGVSFHQFALPGYPASHACVRLLADDAKWIYDWAELWVLAADRQSVEVYGTPVLIFGDYEFDKPGPWTRLADDPSATTITLEEIQRAVEPHREVISERAATRAKWPAR